MKKNKNLFNYNETTLFLIVSIIPIIISVVLSYGITFFSAIYGYTAHLNDKYDVSNEASDDGTIKDGDVAYINVSGYKTEYYLNEITLKTSK